MKNHTLTFILIAVMAMMLVPQQQSTAQDQESLFEIHSTETPIIGRSDADSWHAKWNEPAGIVYHDNLFYLFRNGINTRVTRKGVGVSVSEDGINWTPANDDQPILQAGDVPLTSLGITMTSTIVLDDGTWVGYMHTQESQNWPYDGGEITLATADNPTGPWTAYDSIVLPRGSEGEWDSAQTSYANVLRSEDGFVMYYSGFDANNIISIGMATSDDGFNWTKYDDPTTTEAPYAESDPVLMSEDGSDVTMPHVVYTPEDGWVMIYKNLSYQGDILLATSDDGLQWAPQAVQPIAEDDFGIAAGIGFMKFFHLDGTYYLFLEVVPTGAFSQIHLATYDGSLKFDE